MSRRNKRSRRPRFCTRVSPPSIGRSHRRLARHRRSPARPHLVTQQDPQQTIHRRIQPDLDPPAPGMRAVVRGTRGTKEARQDPSSRRPANRRRSTRAHAIRSPPLSSEAHDDSHSFTPPPSSSSATCRVIDAASTARPQWTLDPKPPTPSCSSSTLATRLHIHSLLRNPSLRTPDATHCRNPLTKHSFPNPLRLDRMQC